MEHRNAFSNDGDYDKDTKEELPMMKSRNARRLAQMVQNAGTESDCDPHDRGRPGRETGNASQISSVEPT